MKIKVKDRSSGSTRIFVRGTYGPKTIKRQLKEIQELIEDIKQQLTLVAVVEQRYE